MEVRDFAFTVDSKRRFDKMSKFQLSDPKLYAPITIESLLDMGAETVEVSTNRKQTRFYARDLKTSKNSLDNFTKELLLLTDKNETEEKEHFSRLSTGILGALGLQPNQIQVNFDDGEENRTLKIDQGFSPEVSSSRSRRKGIELIISEEKTPKKLRKATKKTIRRYSRFSDKVLIDNKPASLELQEENRPSYLFEKTYDVEIGEYKARVTLREENGVSNFITARLLRNGILQETSDHFIHQSEKGIKLEAIIDSTSFTPILSGTEVLRNSFYEDISVKIEQELISDFYDHLIKEVVKAPFDSQRAKNFGAKIRQMSINEASSDFDFLGSRARKKITAKKSEYLYKTYNEKKEEVLNMMVTRGNGEVSKLREVINYDNGIFKGATSVIRYYPRKCYVKKDSQDLPILTKEQVRLIQTYNIAREVVNKATKDNLDQIDAIVEGGKKYVALPAGALATVGTIGWLGVEGYQIAVSFLGHELTHLSAIVGTSVVAAPTAAVYASRKVKAEEKLKRGVRATSSTIGQIWDSGFNKIMGITSPIYEASSKRISQVYSKSKDAIISKRKEQAPEVQKVIEPKREKISPLEECILANSSFLKESILDEKEWQQINDGKTDREFLPNTYKELFQFISNQYVNEHGYKTITIRELRGERTNSSEICVNLADERTRELFKEMIKKPHQHRILLYKIGKHSLKTLSHSKIRERTDTFQEELLDKLENEQKVYSENGIRLVDLYRFAPEEHFKKAYSSVHTGLKREAYDQILKLQRPRPSLDQWLEEV